MQQKQKSITVNLIANGIKTLMSVLFPLITFPYASRILGTVGIGKVNYASSIISYFMLIASLGISTYAVREGARIRDDKEKFNKFAKEILNINLCTTLISYGLLLVFLNLPVLQGYKKLLVIFSAGIVFTTIGTEWLFIIKEEYAYITKRAIVFQLVSLVLLFLLVKSKDDYYWYAALTVISSGGSAILNLWHSRKFVDWRRKYSLEYRKHLKPIFLIFGTSLASSIYSTMDTTMLGAMQGDSAVGIYTAAVKINLVISTLIGTISATILPRVSYYIGNGLKKEYEKLMKASMDVLLMISIPAAIGMICTSDILIYLFSGKEFMSGSLAAKILSVRVVIGAVNRVLAYQVCTPYQKDKEVLISTAAGAVFNLAANALLIPVAGVNGASVATLCAEIIVFLILTHYAGHILKVKALYKRLPVYLAASIWFFAVRWCIDMLVTGLLPRLFITLVVCICGYFVILMLIRDPYLQEYKNKILDKVRVLRH
ncbi:oligosaccharide flippase family protein [Clostridium sp. C105KSO13]|uniref:oligosaccharide flippase family protein n=1 Tax=Clostridium sp. C105KSO13 TaxID=1776045 RepID=UPI00074087BD|nr:oligosaccharide flippase family protein [Clostridium sp. C105KSO13]CUX29236.1 Putative O-antigen transporter [Clostridium sp. C105KSO13]